MYRREANRRERHTARLADALTREDVLGGTRAYSVAKLSVSQCVTSYLPLRLVIYGKAVNSESLASEQNSGCFSD